MPHVRGEALKKKACQILAGHASRKHMEKKVAAAILAAPAQCEQVRRYVNGPCRHWPAWSPAVVADVICDYGWVTGVHGIDRLVAVHPETGRTAVAAWNGHSDVVIVTVTGISHPGGWRMGPASPEDASEGDYIQDSESPVGISRVFLVCGPCWEDHGNPEPVIHHVRPDWADGRTRLALGRPCLYP